MSNTWSLAHFQLDSVFKAFDNSHCPLLQNKPKMFFVQACRGGNAARLSLGVLTPVCQVLGQDANLLLDITTVL